MENREKRNRTFFIHFSFIYDFLNGRREKYNRVSGVCQSSPRINWVKKRNAGTEETSGPRGFRFQKSQIVRISFFFTHPSAEPERTRTQSRRDSTIETSSPGRSEISDRRGD